MIKWILCRIRSIPVAVALLGIMSVSTSTNADTTVNVSIEDLFQAVEGSGSTGGDAIADYAVVLLQKEMEDAGLTFQSGNLVGEIQTPEMEYDTGSCTIMGGFLENGTATLMLTEGTQLDLTVDGIQNAVINAALVGEISMTARAGVEYGFRNPFTNDCVKYDTDHGTVTVTMSLRSDLAFNLELSPSYDPVDVAIIVDKHGNLSGVASFDNVDIDSDFGNLGITDILIDAFEGDLEQTLVSSGETQFEQFITSTNFRLDGLDENGVVDPEINTPFNSPSKFQLPPEIQEDPFLQALIREFDLPAVLFETLDNVPGTLLYSLFVGDEQARASALAAFGAGVACEAVRLEYEMPLDSSPIYATTGGACAAIDVTGSEHSNYYVDAQCLTEIAFRPEDVDAFCETYFGPDSEQLLGNAASWTPDTGQPNDPLPQFESQKWTTSPVTRFDMSVISKADVKHPYMKRVEYKTLTDLSRGGGTCELEMRVYKNDIAATGLKPLLALHGGSWAYRGFAAAGLDATVPFLTQRGFVVFSPFYRLTGQSDGNIECNGASWQEVAADVQDALNWVRQYGRVFGANDEPVTVFGQSSGAHLGAWLATERPSDIEKALLFYPPLDFIDFIQGATQGRYSSHAESGLDQLVRFFGARRGTDEVDLMAMALNGVDVKRPPESLIDLIPDSAFNLNEVDVFDPPRYLEVCAADLGLDLATLDLSLPSPALLDCLKGSLSQFMLSNSFMHKIRRLYLSGTPAAPLYLVQGTSDMLVPAMQHGVFCSALGGAPLPSDLTALPARIQQQCRRRDVMNIVQGAEHMLDFGLCVGEVCPAGVQGSETRQAVIDSLIEGLDWLGLAEM